MASGKSRIGRTLAKHLNRQFYDTDDLVSQRAKMDIPTLFEKEGEAGFRRREAEVVRSLAGNRNLVVATGGGVVLDPKNCGYLRAGGTVIYLNTALDKRYKRVQNPAKRPLLMKGDTYQIMQDLDRIREPIYRALADFIVDNNGGVNLTTTKIIEYLNKVAEA